jgi:hypothetical protein
MLRIVCRIPLVFALASTAWAGPCFRCKHEPVVMPVSLTKGAIVRTPEFLVKNVEYHVEIRVNRGVPLDELSCMIGGNMHLSPCTMFHSEVALEAEWKVLDGDHTVAQGIASGFGPMAWSDSFMDRYLGDFVGEANKKYVVEVKFTRDGTQLDKFSPRLVVRMQDSFYW